MLADTGSERKRIAAGAARHTYRTVVSFALLLFVVVEKLRGFRARPGALLANLDHLAGARRLPRRYVLRSPLAKIEASKRRASL
jgi:hypothetical protein